MPSLPSIIRLVQRGPAQHPTAPAPFSAEPSALLAQALDLVVGAVALARYSSGHSADPGLRRTFGDLATTGEHQAQVLRAQLARHAMPEMAAPAKKAGTSPFIAGAATAAIVIAAATVALLIWRAQQHDTPPAPSLR